MLVNELGIDHWKISAVYGVAQAVVGAGILIAYPYGVKTILMIIAVCFFGFILLTTRIRQIANKHLNRGIS